ncbi:MAG: response regulator [Campylobacterales bacterium]
MSRDYTKLKTIKVLYVEDEELGREHMKEMLQRRFGKVFLAKNGKEALEVVESNKPNVIISDYRMPIMDGKELLLELQKDGNHTPMIFLTAYPDEIGYVSGVKVLEKPFKRSDLLDAIMDVLRL